jgi:hypothetical protein
MWGDLPQDDNREEELRTLAAEERCLSSGHCAGLATIQYEAHTRNSGNLHKRLKQ